MKVEKVSTFKIYVTNIPNGLKNEDVSKLFEPFGRVVESEVFRGNYAFVHMEDADCGRQAVERMDGIEIEGNAISVCQSKNLQGPKIPTMKLAVKNMPSSLSVQDLRNLFTKYGYVLEAEKKGEIGHVLLEATGDIRSAINDVSNYQVGGQVLKVEAVTNVAPSNSTSVPVKPKLLGKRKEPPPPPPLPRPPGRMPGPAGFPPPFPHPGGNNFGPFPPRRPGLPPPPRLLRPGPPPPGMRPYYAGRPPIPPPHLRHPPDFPGDRGFEGTGPRRYFPPPRENFSDDYDDPHYYAPPPRRPPPPPHFHNDEPYGSGSRGPLMPPGPKRIARERFPLGPEPLFNDGPSMYPQEPFGGRREMEQDFYNDYEPNHNPPMRPRPHHPQHNNFKAQPWIPPSGGPPKSNGQAALPKAKVTKFGKVLVEGDVGNAPLQPVGANDKKIRGNRGGVKARAKKIAAASRTNQLPSLLDPIPGTVKVVGDQRNAQVLNNTPNPQSFQLHQRELLLRSGPGNIRPSGPRLPHPYRPPGPPVRGPGPLVGPPGPRHPNNHHSKPKSSLLALYHQSKSAQPDLMSSANQQEEIDFTADIELP